MSQPIPGAPMCPLVILLKAPRPGTVKTRLAADLGDPGALIAYRRLVARLRSNLREWPRVELRFAPDDAAGEIAPWLHPGWTSTPQGAGDLGARLERTFSDHFARRTEPLLVIGADCPEVSPSDLHAAGAALATADVVLGPATDGGYWLIGAKRPCSELFRDMPWSTDRLLAATVERAGTAGLAVATLRERSDVDTLEDWLRVEPTLPEAGD